MRGIFAREDIVEDIVSPAIDNKLLHELSHDVSQFQELSPPRTKDFSASKLRYANLDAATGGIWGPCCENALTVSVMEDFTPTTRIMPVCVLGDQKRQPRVRKMLEQAFVPARRTSNGWVVTAILSSAGVTKSHQKSATFASSKKIERSSPNQSRRRSPLASFQGIPLRWTLLLGVLTNNQKPGGAGQLHNGSGTERQFCLQNPTSTDVRAICVSATSKSFP